MANKLYFHHPNVRGGKSLIVTVGPDQIEWSYSLNTAHWPTYGGEVVQILGVAIEDVTVHGVVHSYAQIENIYSYFLEYIQIASQGRGKDAVSGKTSYNQQPMKLLYPHRGWSMLIIPKSLPGFRKGRDVVAPEWQMQAYMVDDSDDIEELRQLVLQGTSVQGEDFKLTGAVGYQSKNPWSNPFPEAGDQTPKFDPTTQDLWKKVGDYYNTLLPSWTQGDFSAVTEQFGASPAFLHWGTGGATTSNGGKNTGSGPGGVSPGGIP